MIDYEAIGRRVAEQRKYFLKVSQTKMAEELGMYQADISNLEKAKKGSGITDLSKLNLIADYLHIPLESLLFGSRNGLMKKYSEIRAQLHFACKGKKIPKSHSSILKNLMGPYISEEQIKPTIYECGPYTIYMEIEDLYHIAGGKKGKPAVDFILPKIHLFCFCGPEIIGVLKAALTTVMQHVCVEDLAILQEMMPASVLDVTDVLRTLNPYWALWHFSEDGSPEAESYQEKMIQRMDELRNSGENRPVFYVESIYARDDYRRNGACRMLFDTLRMSVEGGEQSVIWLNKEPTAGQELDQEYEVIPAYTVSELGQLELNASIAERLGFTVDPDTWHLKAASLDADGKPTVKTVLKRKCAYFLPKAIREVVEKDGDLVAMGRALQKVVQGPYIENEL